MAAHDSVRMDDSTHPPASQEAPTATPGARPAVATLLRLQRSVGNSATTALLMRHRTAGAALLQRDGDDTAAAGGYVEEQEDFQPDEEVIVDQDLPAMLVGDPDAPAAAPRARFVDGGRTGTAAFGDQEFGEVVVPRAFTDGGQTGSVKWAGGGGAGAHGDQGVGTVQKNVSPVFYQVSKKASAWIKPDTGLLDVKRSWKGVNGGDQGTGHFLTAAASARINQHETLHVARTRQLYATHIDPLLSRVSSETMDKVTASALLPPASPRSIADLKNLIKWGTSVSAFQTADKAANKPGGPIDTADLASGTYPVDAGPGTVAGKAYQHRVRVPAEPTP